MSFFDRFRRSSQTDVAVIDRTDPPLGANFGPAMNLSNMSANDQIFWRSIGAGGGASSAGVAVSEYTALNVPAVYACVNRISNPIAGFPLTVFRPAGDGIEEALDHPISARLKLRPNDLMSSRTLRKTISAHALLWGNGYCEIERNGAGQAVGLWPLLPWDTRPVYQDGALLYRSTIAGVSTDIDHNDVVHIMDQSQDGYIGQSPIRRAANAIGLAVATEQFGSKFFANDAKSGGFLMHPAKLGPNAQTNLEESMKAKSGLENAHRVRILEEGMKWIQTTIPPEDAQFLGTRIMQIAEIARIYDVPLILLQSHDGVPSWGAGIEQLMIGFVRQTIAPWVHAWEQELNWKLFTEQERGEGYYVKFNMTALLRGDSAARAAFYRELFGVGGLSPNQILGLEEMDGIGPDGDHHFVPANFQTIENAVKAPPIVPKQAPQPQPAQAA